MQNFQILKGYLVAKESVKLFNILLMLRRGKLFGIQVGHLKFTFNQRLQELKEHQSITALTKMP